ncbi:MAG: hypothetical protein WC847_00975 [Candidatus Paceibacterota bacterium]|jgi:hypothetical protein
METNKLENPIQPKLTRRDAEIEIFKSLRADVRNAIFPLIEELFNKGVEKDEDLDIFKQELLRIVVTYLPYKKKLDQAHGAKEEKDIFTPEIKLMIEKKLDMLLDSLKGRSTATQRDNAEKVYNKLIDYVSGLKAEKIS